MYLYFNKQGVLTTVIPHGEPVRQGSYLNITVCLDSDFYDSFENAQSYTCNIELSFQNEKIGTPMSGTLLPEPEEFRKTDDSEITYDLIHGNSYWMYKFKFMPEQATMKAGKIFANISLMRTSLEQNSLTMEETEVVDTVYYGTADIYVERTFGMAKQVNDMSTAHYQNLVAMLNQVNTNKVSLLGDKIIILSLSDFTKENSDDNFKSFVNDKTNWLSSNKYQFVKIEDYYYQLISSNEEYYWFLTIENNTSISFLSYCVQDKKWMLFDDRLLITVNEVENKILELSNAVYAKIQELTTNIENRLKVIVLGSGNISPEDLNLINLSSHVLVKYNNEYYTKLNINNNLAYFTCVSNKNSNIVYKIVSVNLDSGKYETSEKVIPYLDSNGKILNSFIPSWTNDVLVGYYYKLAFYNDENHTELITPEEGKIYIDLGKNEIYRWKNEYISLKADSYNPTMSIIKIEDGRYEVVYYESDDNYVVDETLYASNDSFDEQDSTMETDEDYEVIDESVLLP